MNKLCGVCFGHFNPTYPTAGEHTRHPWARQKWLPGATALRHVFWSGCLFAKRVNRRGESVRAPIGRAGVQPGELPAAVGAAEVNSLMEPDHLAREARQDRGGARIAREIHCFPTGRCRGAEEVFPPYRGPDRPVAFDLGLGLRSVLAERAVGKLVASARGALPEHDCGAGASPRPSQGKWAVQIGFRGVAEEKNIEPVPPQG
jgi:hypothetical protein